MAASEALNTGPTQLVDRVAAHKRAAIALRQHLQAIAGVMP